MPLAGPIGRSCRFTQLPDDPLTTFQLSFLLGLSCTNSFDDVRRGFCHEALIGKLCFLALDEAAEFVRFFFLAIQFGVEIHEVGNREVAVGIAQRKADRTLRRRNVQTGRLQHGL